MSPSDLTAFTWEQQPQAAALVEELLGRFRTASPAIAQLEQRLHDETGARLLDWVEAIFLAGDADMAGRLKAVGFREDGDAANAWRHPGGMFPTIALNPAFFVEDATADVLAIKVDAVEDFSRVYSNGAATCRGKAGSPLRTAVLPATSGPLLAAIERHGHRTFDWCTASDKQIAQAAKHRQAFAQRTRHCQTDKAGFELAAALFEAAAADLGVDWACDLFFAPERDYWMSRNRAGRVQYGRQQRLGLGWANHDHHTYRSSRASFQDLVGVLELMGFACRERFYAGREAGWGAQVLEQPRAGLVVFADVDLSPEELSGDFSHEPLLPRDELGTVGLWCALHGESFLEAGMHHLECQFDFDAARAQLREAGVETMAPFTNFSFLRQAFTVGEMWPVSGERLAKTQALGAINAEQAEKFRSAGVLGSHLEILQRNDGYKGFNQTGVSDIIARTDPRTAAGA
jgi:hypothetical protein